MVVMVVNVGLSHLVSVGHVSGVVLVVVELQVEVEGRTSSSRSKDDVIMFIVH